MARKCVGPAQGELAFPSLCRPSANVVSCDGTENITTHLTNASRIAAALLRLRFGLTPLRAQLVAELAGLGMGRA